MRFCAEVDCSFTISAENKSEAEFIAGGIMRQLHNIISQHGQTGSQKNNWIVNEEQRQVQGAKKIL